jgi:MFS transporter, DHA1 family, tetracycline resistance protein
MKFRKTIPPLALLFSSNLAILFVGMGLFPILPYYANLFGASPVLVGLYFAVINAALSAGSLVSGTLAQRFSINRLYIYSGAVGVPALVLLGQASQLWQVVVLTSLVWFVGGLNLSLISMLLAMTTPQASRGRAFSLLALNVPLGALFGAAWIGALVAQAGYSVMFWVLGLVWAAVPLAGLFLPEEEKPAAVVPGSSPAQPYKFYRLSEPFAAVLFISMIAVIAISVGRLGVPMAMQSNAFSSSQVASTAMVSGVIAIPVLLLATSFSDRISRSRFLIFAYLLAAAGLIALAVSTLLWHYWVAASLIMVSFCLNGALASAAAADVLPAADLKRGLAWLNALLPAASIIAFAGTGFLAEMMGFSVFFFMVAGLPLAASGLMEYALQRCRRALKAQNELVVEMPYWEENAYLKRCL